VLLLSVRLATGEGSLLGGPLQVPDPHTSPALPPSKPPALCAPAKGLSDDPILGEGMARVARRVSQLYCPILVPGYANIPASVCELSSNMPIGFLETLWEMESQ